MFAKDFDFTLPSELIAQEPAKDRDLSRVLYMDGTSGYFHSIVDHISGDDVMFLNNTQVIKARVKLKNFIHIRAGEQRVRPEAEIFFVTQKNQTDFEALISPGKWFRIGDIIQYEKHTLEVISMTSEGRILRLIGNGVSEWFELHGNLPLPPYIAYDASKEGRYQTIFASHPGALAAPTASLHFTPEIFTQLSSQGVEQYQLTLHVGLGTFKHIDPATLASEISLHDEEIVVSIGLLEKIAQIKNNSSKKILAVGTTVVRTLESLPILFSVLPDEVIATLSDQARDFWSRLSDYTKSSNVLFDLDRKVSFLSYDSETQTICASTRIFLYPGYQFVLVDRLITNFHLPKSSLLMLVCAFAGKDLVLHLYEQAVAEGFRFFSFGDAMLLEKSVNESVF